MPSLQSRPQPWSSLCAPVSKKNLDMCTEALGCETGGVDAAVGDGLPLKRADDAPAEVRRRPRAGRARREDFPPPLTTLGASRLRMVHERRDGRLAVYSVRMPGVEAERGGGRLRLHLLPCGGRGGAEASRTEQEGFLGAVGEEETKGVVVLRDVNAKVEEAAMEVAKYRRAGRCMQGGRRWRKREEQQEVEAGQPFWVATS